MKHSVRTIASVAGTLSVFLAVLMPATCRAHPGHGSDGGDWSLHHYLTEPEHVAALLGVLLVAVALRVLLKVRARSMHGTTERTIRRPDELSASAKRAR